MVLVTVGTQNQQFTRIFNIVEKSQKLKNQEIICQIGNTIYSNDRMKIFKFISNEDMGKLVQKADIIICHAGVGTIFDGLHLGKKIIAVPRYAKYKEHVDDHQLEICDALENEKYILTCRDNDNLDDIISKSEIFEFKKYQKNEDYLEILRKEI